MKNYDELAQKVWGTADINEKRQYINEMIDNFQYPSKADKFREGVMRASAKRLDQIAANLMLNDTDKVL